jgi:signal transduction histidine kinase
MNEGRGDGRHPDWPAFTGRDWVNTAWEGRRRLSITITNGLPDQHVWCSARTSDGKIWMGTDRHGLLGYDGRAVTVLDKRDGMSGSMVLGLAATPDDSLWVGFLDGGVVRYRPSKARPSVRLRGVQVDGETLTNFTTIPKLTTGRRVTFQYQGIDQKTHPEKRQFWYRLMNASGRTVYSAVSKDRSFDWVPEERGAHTFEVQSIDRDLNYSEPAHMVMQVNVPWHANAWILGSLAGAFAGLLAWAFVARAMYQRKSREAIVLRERVRISRDLHDHLGAGLTHLAMMGDMVRQRAAQPDAVEMLAGRLTESARELTRTMGEVIWTTDPDKDSLRSFSLFLTSYAERFFSESSLRLRFEIPEQVPDMLLPSEFRSSLLTVTKEALNNVAKHSQATELRIKLDLRDRELHVSFEDNGRGFAMDEVAPDRHGLVNMRERLRDLPGELRIESLEGQGTHVEIRCSLPKR